MKAFVKVFGWMSIVGALLLFPPPSEAGPLGAMRVNIVQGDVQVKIADTGEWVPASVNMPLVEGDELWVPEGSRAALQTTRGDYVRLDGNTALQILRMDLDSYQFHLTEGRVYVLNRAPKRNVLQFDTPDASIRAFGNARFRIDILGGETDVSVFRGSVQTENGDGTTTVRAGNMLAVGADGYAELSPVPPSDDWQRWNAQRDRIVLARGKSYGYLPEELRAYSSDFDGGGRWVNVPEYGYCWTPTVIVINDWAPYRHGRWVWRGGDYVWVGYEPWGWAPYHYGRWARRENLGWIWAPAKNAVFKPGEVYWLRGAKLAGWGPLAPGERWTPGPPANDQPQQFLNVNSTFAEFQQDATVIDPAGFAARPKEPLLVAAFAPALPSPAFPAARLDAVRPLVRGSRIRVVPVVDGVTFESNSMQPVVVVTPPPPQPVVVITQPAPDPPEPAPPVAYPVPVYTPILVRESGRGDRQAALSAISPPKSPPARSQRPTPPRSPSGGNSSRAVMHEKRFRDSREQQMFTQVVQDVNNGNFAKAVAALDAWTQRYPESDYQDDRLYYYVIAYDGARQPAKVVDAARRFAVVDMPPAFQDARQIILACYLASANVPRVTNLTPAQFTTCALAARRLLNSTQSYFTPENRPPETSSEDWSKARNELEATAKTALNILKAHGDLPDSLHAGH